MPVRTERREYLDLEPAWDGWVQSTMRKGPKQMSFLQTREETQRKGRLTLRS